MKHEQITAWALDELSPQEREQIEAALKENPGTGDEARATKDFCHFLLKELRDESLELTSEQRSRLQTMPPASNIILPSSTSKPVRWSFASRFGSLAAAAACVAAGGYWMYPWFQPQKDQIVAEVVEEEKLFRVNGPQIGQNVSSAPVDLPGKSAPPSFGNSSLTKPLNSLQPYSAAPPTPAAKPAESNLAFTGATTYAGGVTVNGGTLEVRSGGVVASKQRKLDLTSESDVAKRQLAAVMPSAAPSAPMPAEPALRRDEPFKSAYEQPRSKMLAQVDEKWEDKTPANSPPPATPSTPTVTLSGGLIANQSSISVPGAQAADDLSHATQFKKRTTINKVVPMESYTRILENELKDVLREPLSTFSIDVDTSSYANVRRFLNQNMIPPADAVRIEELINYFPGDEEGPAADAKEPFAARVELATCPWQPHHRLARIAIQGKQVQKGSKASNLVFLVDVSGSMDDPQKLPLVKQSLRMLAEQMGEGDRVSMVTYASGTQVVLPPTNGENRSRVIAAVDQLQANGSTNGAGGLQLAYEQAVAGFIQDGINRVILCTDGDFNVGISDPAQLEKFIAEKARSGVFLSVLGFGSGNLKDRTMETLADKGNGNYAYIDGLAEARKVLVEQMAGTLVTIAKDVKVQIEFNPAQVRAYRLIGYENRLLAKEDFNDDTKDAGEIGSGHRVIALYELVPANLPPGVGPDRLVDTLKYQTLASPTPKELNETKSAATGADAAAASKELMTVKLRYKEPQGETSSKIELPVTDDAKTLEAASSEFQFSASVAAFGLLLRDSGYKGTLTWEAVRKLALAGKGPDKLGYRGEFLQLIDKAAGLKQTRP
ncbi:MAG: von Willebrand factor type A domain-containing protein [Verrucomicrobiaceae bacterium]